MLSFTGNLILWILCILFRFFVITGVCYGIYKFFKDKIDDISRNRYIRKCQEQHKREMEEAMGLNQMTEEQIKEEKQIQGEIKFTILACGIILALVILFILIKKY